MFLLMSKQVLDKKCVILVLTSTIAGLLILNLSSYGAQIIFVEKYHIEN